MANNRYIEHHVETNIRAIETVLTPCRDLGARTEIAKSDWSLLVLCFSFCYSMSDAQRTTLRNIQRSILRQRRISTYCYNHQLLQHKYQLLQLNDSSRFKVQSNTNQKMMPSNSSNSTKTVRRRKYSTPSPCPPILSIWPSTSALPHVPSQEKPHAQTETPIRGISL